MLSTVNATPRAALYLRQSLDAAADGLAVARQREACRRIADERGWEIVGEYVDNSVSASDRRKVRPGYDQLTADYAAGRFDALICYDLDRLTRQPRQLEDWIDAAEGRGLRLVTANGEADLSTDGGRLFARIKASVARAEIERKSARQRAAAAQRADHGRPPLGPRLFGYTTRGAVVEREAAVVREVFARFAAGDSLRALVAWLTAAGVKTRRGGRWNPSTVATMLRNVRYAGRAVYDGAPTGKPGTWEAIVSPEVFDRVQRRLADPRRRTHHEGYDRRYLGSGLFRCAECDRPVISHTGNRYRCPGGCLIRSSQPIDDLVIRVVRARLARSDLAGLLPNVDTDTARALTAAVDALGARLEQIEHDYDTGLIDGRRYRVATEKARAELSAARAKLAALTGPAGSPVLQADDPAAAFDDAPLMIRRHVIDLFVTVRLCRVPQGRRGFDPASVAIEWRNG